MKVNILILSGNPFFEAYLHSDLMGKAIFIGLILISISSWIIILYKGWLTFQARQQARSFHQAFTQQKQTPLNLPLEGRAWSPFSELYGMLKQQTLEILNKNRLFAAKGSETAYLSPSDIDLLEGHLMSGISHQIKELEKYLFVLSTAVSLGPFLGLLGTVWGILTTFSEMQSSTGSSNQMVIGGLSLALATTVLGLLAAIPALIGYNYLKNSIRDFETEMEGFSTEILSSVELQYRQVDVR